MGSSNIRTRLSAGFCKTHCLLRTIAQATTSPSSCDASGNVTSDLHGLSGLTNLNNPVNIVEDPNTGNIYVAELGGQKLMLLRPMVPGTHLSADTSLVAMNSVAAGNSGAGPSPAQSITITNKGNATLTFGSASIVKDPSVATNDATAFSIVSGLPSSLAAGQSATIQVRFTASRVGVASAVLPDSQQRRFDCDHYDHPAQAWELRGNSQTSSPASSGFWICTRFRITLVTRTPTTPIFRHNLPSPMMRCMPRASSRPAAGR